MKRKYKVKYINTTFSGEEKFQDVCNLMSKEDWKLQEFHIDPGHGAIWAVFYKDFE